MTEAVLLYATAPDEKVAEDLARHLVESGAAACVNVLAGMRSVYRWRGAVETADEAVLIVKTTDALAPRARDLILARHPYENPAVVAIDVDERLSSKPFCDWLKEPDKISG